MRGASLLSELGVRLPIVQAPMAGVSSPALAAAVTNAGGLGSLGIAAMTATQVSDAILETRRLTAGPVHVNVFCHKAPLQDEEKLTQWLQHLQSHFSALGATVPDRLDLLYRSFDEQAEVSAVLLDLKPEIVSFHFGLPAARTLAQLRSAGIRLMATATNVAEAHSIAAAGLDAIIAQGFEAGGHRGVFDDTARDERLTTLSLTRLLARSTPLPIIAAGGIMDGAAIAAVQALGAMAAQLGTAFVACPESNADAGYREALLQGGATGTVMTKAISGRPARGLVNSLTEIGEDPACPPVPAYPLAYAAGKLLHAAASRRGNSAYGAHWAGQSVAMVRPMPAAELVRTLAQEWQACRELFSSSARVA